VHEPPPNNQPAAGNLQVLGPKRVVAKVVVEILEDPEQNADYELAAPGAVERTDYPFSYRPPGRLAVLIR
jgi:hypothetical protein